MVLPESLRRAQFSDRLSQAQEEVRVMKERIKFLLGKISGVERKKKKSFAEIIEKTKELNYDEVRKRLEEEYLRLVEKEELPALQILMSSVYTHRLELQASLHGLDPDKVLPHLADVLGHYVQLQQVIETRIADLKDEIVTIRDALAKGIPLSDLARLNADEQREQALARRIQDMESPLKRHMHDMEAQWISKIMEMSTLVQEFEQEHGTIQRGMHLSAEGLKKATRLVENLGERCEWAGFAFKIIEIGATLAIGPEALIGEKVEKVILELVEHADEAGKAAQLLEQIREINGKLKMIAEDPENPQFDKEFAARVQETQREYANML